MKKFIAHKISNLLRLPVVGLDISDRTFKYLKLAFDGKIEVEAFGENDIPENIIEGGEIKDESKLTEIFKKWKKNNAQILRSSVVVASLPEEKSFLRLIQLPKVKSRSIVESYTNTIQAAGLTLAALELESQAIIRAVVQAGTPKSAKIIIDLGKTRTSFITFAGSAIIFTSTIKLGGNTFEENIMRALAVDREKAKEIKEKMGLNRSTNKDVFTALTPALSVLVDELKRVIAYYQEHVEHLHGVDQTIDEILLVGGDANLFGIDTFVASALKIPVRQADPFINIKKLFDASFPPIPKTELLAFATTIGLSLREIE
ncbi:MAG: Tfp pilus assembly protein, ATPase PilM [Candidatus Adlerbacteria bacterium GW2011_GWC1_50_9]|uniref:Tfp pilus assembly protein, ATPase PilM n=1 Tax=Candidatus Adlerbacteria bacterium GW2011_GWC1_50_9 TaxID=1618608 RepID=A0A0G1WPP0_9BACT|nr:MAG: Tfp pilus assembly protein, ATPase PilM [Candidatus Adlerbacteria bacterium GW2011_GWC1_50_9]